MATLRIIVVVSMYSGIYNALHLFSAPPLDEMSGSYFALLCIFLSIADDKNVDYAFLFYCSWLFRVDCG